MWGRYGTAGGLFTDVGNIVPKTTTRNMPQIHAGYLSTLCPLGALLCTFPRSFQSVHLVICGQKAMIGNLWSMECRQRLVTLTCFFGFVQTLRSVSVTLIYNA